MQFNNNNKNIYLYHKERIKNVITTITAKKIRQLSIKYS